MPLRVSKTSNPARGAAQTILPDAARLCQSSPADCQDLCASALPRFRASPPVQPRLSGVPGFCGSGVFRGLRGTVQFMVESSTSLWRGWSIGIGIGEHRDRNADRDIADVPMSDQTPDQTPSNLRRHLPFLLPVPAQKQEPKAGAQRLSIPSFSGLRLSLGSLLQASPSGCAQAQPKPRSALAGTSRGLRGTSRVTSPPLSAVSGL